jgi:DNA-binding transcriptional LysR family regulator
VGQRLFDRHGQTIAPTVFGAIAIDTARKLLDSQEAMTRAIDPLQQTGAALRLSET